MWNHYLFYYYEKREFFYLEKSIDHRIRLSNVDIYTNTADFELVASAIVTNAVYMNKCDFRMSSDCIQDFAASIWQNFKMAFTASCFSQTLINWNSDTSVKTIVSYGM